jgi:hypothetical protein
MDDRIRQAFRFLRGMLFALVPAFFAAPAAGQTPHKLVGRQRTAGLERTRPSDEGRLGERRRRGRPRGVGGRSHPIGQIGCLRSELKAAVESGKIQVIGGYYSLDTGAVTFLDQK